MTKALRSISVVLRGWNQTFLYVRDLAMCEIANCAVLLAKIEPLCEVS
jgi:hypothetical protein